MEKKYYNLYHEYESSEGVDISKFIGIFESKELANKAIYRLMKKKGFNEYSKECFEISECWVDSYYGWRTGFISIEEIQNELNDKENDIL